MLRLGGVHQRLELIGILAVDLACRIGEFHRDAELPERGLLAFWQRDLEVAAVVRIRARHDVQRHLQIGSAARERPDHRNVSRRD